MHRVLRSLVGLSAFAGVGLVPMTAWAGPLQNGGFETGNLSGWTVSGFTDYHINGSSSSPESPFNGGPQYSTFAAAQQLNSGSDVSTPTTTSDAVVSAQTSAFDGMGPSSTTPIAPYSGTFLGFVSNENSSGNNSMTGSSISQTFTVPTGATQLNYSIQLLNNDTTSAPARLRHDDFGGIALLNGSTVLAQYNIDIGGNGSANATVIANTLTGGFYNSSGWLTHSFNLAGDAGQNLTLVAYVTNYGGDNSVESRLLVDNITVPEPASLSLLGFGAGALLIRRWPRQQTSR